MLPLRTRFAGIKIKTHTRVALERLLTDEPVSPDVVREKCFFDRVLCTQIHTADAGI